MSIEYTYVGLDDEWHHWDVNNNGNTYKYARHIDDENIRQDIIQKYEALGFTQQEIGLIIGPEMLHGLEDFSIRDSYLD